MTAKGLYTGNDDDDDDDDDDNDDNDDNDSLPPLESVSVAALSDSETETRFKFWGKEAVLTAFGYTDIAFDVFARGYILFLIGFSSSSSSAGAGTDEDVVALGASR